MSALRILLELDSNTFLVFSLTNGLQEIFDVFLFHLCEGLDFAFLKMIL